MNEELDAIYARTGRDSIPPERLLRASLIQTLHSIRAERALVDLLGEKANSSVGEERPQRVVANRV